ncbi:hypothetical protein N7513_008350 [Penicillium frequentans]|nr:hypothetical protein N7513_008350 [Penicillium glabrum]
MPESNLTSLSPLQLSVTAESFLEPPGRSQNPADTPLNAMTGCRTRLEKLLSRPDIYEITVVTQAESKISPVTENEFDEDTILGFLAVNKEENALDQLFVHSRAQGLGLGAVLLALAKTRLPQEKGGFWLRTAEGNLPACRFYEKNGLRVIGLVSMCGNDTNAQLYVTTLEHNSSW